MPLPMMATPIVMPAFLVSVLLQVEDDHHVPDKFNHQIFQPTSSLGS
jgi:hypothetical protein